MIEADAINRTCPLRSAGGPDVPCVGRDCMGWTFVDAAGAPVEYDDPPASDDPRRARGRCVYTPTVSIVLGSPPPPAPGRGGIFPPH